MRAQIWWESGDQQRGEEESISPNRIMISPFHEINCRLVIWCIGAQGRYYEGTGTSGTSWKWGVSTNTKRGSTSIPSILHCQGTYIRLLIHIWSAPSVGSIRLRMIISGANEWGRGDMSKMRIYYLPYLPLYLKLYWGSESVYLMYIYRIEKTRKESDQCGIWETWFCAENTRRLYCGIWSAFPLMH